MNMKLIKIITALTLAFLLYQTATISYRFGYDSGYHEGSTETFRTYTANLVEAGWLPEEALEELP